jgi:hypothetical protein
MTTYRHLSTGSVSGYRAVYLTHTDHTPLGETYQSEIVYVQAYNDEEAKKKASRLLKKNVVECIDNISAGPEYADVWDSRTVTVGDDTYKIPTALHDRIAADAIAPKDKMIAQLIDECEMLKATLDDLRSER